MMKRMTRRMELVILDLIGWGLAAGGVYLILHSIQKYLDMYYMIL